MPSLPAGLTLAAPMPTPPNVTAAIPAQLPCCTLPTVPAFKIPNPLGPLVFNPAVVGVLSSALQAMETFLDQLPLSCPRS